MGGDTIELVVDPAPPAIAPAAGSEHNPIIGDGETLLPREGEERDPATGATGASPTNGATTTSDSPPPFREDVSKGVERSLSHVSAGDTAGAAAGSAHRSSVRARAHTRWAEPDIPPPVPPFARHPKLYVDTWITEESGVFAIEDTDWDDDQLEWIAEETRKEAADEETKKRVEIFTELSVGSWPPAVWFLFCTCKTQFVE